MWRPVSHLNELIPEGNIKHIIGNNKYRLAYVTELF